MALASRVVNDAVANSPVRATHGVCLEKKERYALRHYAIIDASITTHIRPMPFMRDGVVTIVGMPADF